MDPDEASTPLLSGWQLWPQVVLFALAILGALAWLGWGRALAWDEVEFTRATEWIRQGRVPFRDFWEHHTPLTWALMAPWKALFHGPGANTVLAMRWGQLPLWLGAFMGLNAWMRDQGLPAWNRLTLQALLLASPFFTLWALQYRIDVAGVLFVVLALLASSRLGRTRAAGLICGACLGLAVIANLRFGPLAAVALLSIPWMDLENRRWKWRRGAARIWAGFALVALLLSLFLVATRSGGLWWQHIILENAMTDSLVQHFERNFGNVAALPFVNLDLAGMILLLGGSLGLVAALRTLHRPGLLQQLAILQLANLVFVARMKVNYAYHFQLVLLLMLPFLGEMLQASSRLHPGPWGRRLCTGLLSLQLLMNAFAFAEHRQTGLLRYQNQIMVEADRATASGEQVLDGCGFALNREPAYRYWFLAVNVRALSVAGRIPRYPLEDFRDRPPGAVIYNGRTYNWFQEWPDLENHLVSHYLPRYSNLWLPGMSGLLDPQHPFNEWTVPRSGSYLLAGSAPLANHPWFERPLHFGLRGSGLGPRTELPVAELPVPAGPEVDWTLNGRPLPPDSRRVALNQGDRLTATFHGQGRLGLLIVDDRWTSVFEPAPPLAHMDELFFDYY